MEVVTDFEGMDWAEVIDTIKEKCNLTEELTVCLIVIDNWHESYYYDITETKELYEFLNELVQGNDCKNGCELREDNGEVYFAIVGSNRYSKATGEFVTTDEVRVHFRNYTWR